MSRKALYVIPLIVLVGGGLFYWFQMRAGGAVVTYTTVTVTRGRVEAKVTATGTVSPLVTVQVGSQISGRVAALYADFNAKVKKGQIIAKLDTALLEAAVDQARASVINSEGNLAKAQAQAVDAKRQATRNAELLEKKLIAQADADTADSNRLAADAGVVAAQGQLALSKASLQQAVINLRYATIYSPINGVVISVSVAPGQTVAATMTAPTLYSIAEDLAKMQVDTSVAESDVGRLVEGMPAVFTVDAYPGERFKGKVRQVRNSPTTTQNVVTYDAVVDVGNPDLKLKPGMTANVSFVYADRNDVLKMPAATLRFQMPDANPDGKKSVPKTKMGRHVDADAPRNVWVMTGTPAVPTKVPIHVGITDGTFVEVLDGLQEGDQVVTEANDPTGSKKSPSGGGSGGANPGNRHGPPM